MSSLWMNSLLTVCVTVHNHINDTSCIMSHQSFPELLFKLMWKLHITISLYNYELPIHFFPFSQSEAFIIHPSIHSSMKNKKEKDVTIRMEAWFGQNRSMIKDWIWIHPNAFICSTMFQYTWVLLTISGLLPYWSNPHYMKSSQPTRWRKEIEKGRK